MTTASANAPTQTLAPLPTGLMGRTQAAAWLTSQGYRTAPATLAKYACCGAGPQHQKFGRKPLYLAIDLLQWAIEHTSMPRRSTSEVA